MLERFHLAALPGANPAAGSSEDAGSLERLMALFAAAWRRSGFGESDDELQFRESAIEALRRYHAREVASGRTHAGSSASSTSGSGPTTCAAGSTGSTSCRAAATS